ncbi:MAG: CcdB family protein [Sulfurovum sp.]|nr:CcdB family protein [Sulfurovum sp.]
MAQFDVYRNPSKITSKKAPYLLELQSNLHNRLHSRLVVPLVVGEKPVRHLTPVFEIEGQTVVMYTMDMTSVMQDVLSVKVTNIEEYRTKIVDALDFLVNGF